MSKSVKKGGKVASFLLKYGIVEPGPQGPGEESIGELRGIRTKGAEKGGKGGGKRAEKRRKSAGKAAFAAVKGVLAALEGRPHPQNTRKSVNLSVILAPGRYRRPGGRLPLQPP